MHAARARFVEADLAAGIAAIDSHMGQPGQSLDWHLERATRHARARYNAQRVRPPSLRADAERPERRLGAHRLAIAACDVAVVDALARELATQARAISAGRARAADPPVLRYIAAVDLLAGHRSYEAAQLLLQHLLHQSVDGPAWQALQSAICRSPNAALVDGLLSVVEVPQSHPARAIAAAAELLGLRRESAALRALRRLTAQGSPPVRQAAVVALGRIGDRGAIESLLATLEDPKLAEGSAIALLLLGDRRGIDFHGRALHDRRADLHGHPGELVGRYGGPEHLLLLIASSDGDDDRALGALQGLGLVGDARGVPPLLSALGHRDRRVQEIASGALTILTGHHDTIDDPGFRNRWHDYWEANAAKYPEGARFRDGQRMDAALLLTRMADDDPWVRRTAYDELCITTGARLPFDADGPWRVQVAHLRAWRRWWAANKATMPAGAWLLDGKRIHG